MFLDFYEKGPTRNGLIRLLQKKAKKEGIDGNILHLFRCWALHAALKSAPMDFHMAHCTELILSGRRKFLTRKQVYLRASPCRKYHGSAEQELPTGSCLHCPMLVAVVSQSGSIHSVP